MAKRRLRPHQTEAVEAAVLALSPDGVDMPASGLRAQVIAATGTGKTDIAAAVAARVAPAGRVLVLVPTLDLLTQTAASWKRAGRRGSAIAVCSLDVDPGSGLRATTSAPQLALWAGRRSHVTVYATYASLGVLLDAHAGLYGLSMLPWDLVVVDEAHRTSGHLGKAWAAIHDNELIPAARRLYLTATPRIWEPRQDSAYGVLAAEPVDDVDDDVLADGAVEDGLEEWDVEDTAPDVDDTPDDDVEERAPRRARQALPQNFAASMDDESLFGPVAFRYPLSTAVRHATLAPFRIIVVEVADPEVQAAARKSGSELNGHTKNPDEVEEFRGKRLAALQTALLRTASEYDLRTIITFHHRVIEAEAFAEGLPKAAARLRETDPGAYSGPLWANWVSGEHDTGRRRAVLDDFADRVERAGGIAVLANCRVLGEGIDIPGVDSVAILDPKGSIVEICQAVGRALRLPPQGTDKVASIVVPVWLEEGESADDMLVSSSWRPLVRVLQALRSHDQDIVDVLAVPQVNGTPQGILAADDDVDQDQDDVVGDGEKEETRPLLRFSTRRDPAELLRFVQTQVIDPQPRSWRRGLAAAERYAREHGDLAAPLDTVDVDSAGRVFPLGTWISEQRREHTLGRLAPERVEILGGLGMVWRATDRAWDDGLAMARAYARTHGHLAAPLDAAVDGFAVGQWLQNRRRHARALDKHPGRRAALDALDPDWNPQAWSVEWQRHLHHARAHLAHARNVAHGAQAPDGSEDGVRFGDERAANASEGSVRFGGVVPVPAPGTLHRAVDVGQWIARQQERWNELNPAQRAELGRLGVPAPAAPAKPVRPGGARNGRSRDEAFTLGLTAATAYQAREGDLEVPRKHTETVTGPDGTTEDVKLGIWVTNTRGRRAKLPADRVAALDTLGMRWT